MRAFTVSGREGLIERVELAGSAEIEGSNWSLHVLSIGHELGDLFEQKLDASGDVWLGERGTAFGHDVHKLGILDRICPGCAHDVGSCPCGKVVLGWYYG